MVYAYIMHFKQGERDDFLAYKSKIFFVAYFNRKPCYERRSMHKKPL